MASMRAFLCCVAVVLLVTCTNAVEEERAHMSDSLLSSILREHALSKAGVKFEGEEHRSICREAAKGIKMWFDVSKVTLVSLKCVEGNEASTDEMSLEVRDDDKMTTLAHDFKSKGDVWDFDGGKAFSFTTNLKFQLWEIDRGRDAYIDSDDFLGEWTVTSTTSDTTHTFSLSGKYELTLRFDQKAGPAPADALPLVNLKDITVDLPIIKLPSYPLSYVDICSLAGDFYAGDDPKSDSIGYDVDQKRLRTPAEMLTKFKAVFDWFWKKNDPSFSVEIVKLLKHMDKEATSIARHKSHPDESINMAYSEQDSRYGGSTLDFVTNTHNNNFAKITLGLEPDLDVYWNSVSQGLSTKKWSREKHARFWNNAAYNFDHFQVGQAGKIWQLGHENAIAYAFEASQKATPAERDLYMKRSLAMSAFANHFGTDLFSGGHIRSERTMLYEERLTMGSGCEVDGGEYASAETAGVAAALFHDEDGDVGINVRNAHTKWKAYGDRWYNRRGHETGRQQVTNFVKATIEDIKETIHGSCYGAPTKTAQACISQAFARTGNAKSFLPEVDPDAKNHPPLYKKENGVVYYRSSWFYEEPAKYTSNWDCDNIYFGQWSLYDRFGRRNEVVDVMRAMEVNLQQTYFTSMDTDESGSVTHAEFADWVHTDVFPSMPAEPGTSQLILAVYNKMRKDTSLELKLDDIQSLISVQNGKYKYTLKQYLAVEFAKSIKAPGTPWASTNPENKVVARADPDTAPQAGGPAAPRPASTASHLGAVAKNDASPPVRGPGRRGAVPAATPVSAAAAFLETMRRVSTNPGSGGTPPSSPRSSATPPPANAALLPHPSSPSPPPSSPSPPPSSPSPPPSSPSPHQPSPLCNVFGIDFCKITEIISTVAKTAQKIMDMTAADLEKQLAGLKAHSVLPQDAQLESLRQIVKAEMLQASRGYVRRKAERKENAAQNMDEHKSTYWTVMAALHDMNPSVQAKQQMLPNVPKETKQQLAAAVKTALDAAIAKSAAMATAAALAPSIAAPAAIVVGLAAALGPLASKKLMEAVVNAANPIVANIPCANRGIKCPGALPPGQALAGAGPPPPPGSSTTPSKPSTPGKSPSSGKLV